MGCGNSKEDLEDKIMLIRLKRMNIQMEREKNLKLLSDLEGYTINMENLPDYLAASDKAKLMNVNIDKKESSSNLNKLNEKTNDIPKEVKGNDHSPTLINNSIHNEDENENENENENEKENNKENENEIKIENYEKNNDIDFSNKDKIELKDDNVDKNNALILDLNSGTKREPKKKKRKKIKKTIINK